MRAAFALKPSASKRLIARAAIMHPLVRHAVQHGCVIIANGTTNAFIAEELCQRAIRPKLTYAAGLITPDGLTESPGSRREKPIVLEQGQIVDRPWTEALRDLTAGDVFIKGANAIDHNGYAGILLGRGDGGTIGIAIGSLQSRGIPIIIPVGLEKLVFSVPEAQTAVGIKTMERSIGHRIGLMVVTNGILITEITACRLLYNVRATHAGSGGVDGAEGSVVIAVEGEPSDITRLMDDIETLRTEPNLTWEDH